MNLKFRTKAACRIARIEAQRFNEDVAAGDYPCAPETTSGVSRVFDEADIAGLTVYAHLMRVYEPQRYTKKTAAMYACGVIRALRERQGEDQARADFPLNGFNNMWVHASTTDAPIYVTGEGISAFAATLCFDLNSILKEVRLRMDQEARILGEED